MDLKSLANAIAVKEEVLAVEREQEDVILINLGQALHESGPDGDTPSDLTESVDDCTGKLEEFESSLRELLDNEEKRRDRVEESKTLKVEERNLNNRQEKAHDDLGRSAWDLWKSGKQPDEALGLALQELSRTDAKIHDAEVAAFRNESDVTGKGRSLFSRGRALFLESRKKTASASMDRLWSRAGKSVYETVGLETIDSESIQSALTTLETLDSRLNEIRNRQNSIAGEIDELDSSQEELPGKGNVRRRVSHIEKSIDEARVALDHAYLKLGSGWMEQFGENKASGDVERCRFDCLAIHERVRKAEIDMEAFKAHRKFIQAENEKQKKASKVHRLEQEIKDRQAQLKAEKKELVVMEKELAGLSESLPSLPGDDQDQT